MIVNKIKLLTVIVITISFLSCFQSNSSGRLGIEVPIGKGKVSDETPYVIHSVYEGPAYDAGILPDDVIVLIDGVSIRNGMKHDYIYNNLLVGKAGTKVIIVVDRKGERLVFNIIRAEK